MLVRITFLFFLFSLTSLTSFGQAKKFNPGPITTKSSKNLRQAQSNNARSAVPELIIPTIFQDTLGCGFNFVTFSVNSDDNWGFVSGTNGFMDLEKAQLFNYDGADYQILELDIFFDVVSVVGDGDIFAKIYEVDPSTAGPGALIAVSDAVKMSEVAVDSQLFVPTVFTFSEIPQVADNQFFVSIDMADLYNTNDTISIAMTDQNCGIAGETWELFSDGQTWAAYADDASWGLQSNLFMVAVVEPDALAATKDLLVGNQRIRLHDAFPNPTKDEITINFEMDMKMSVSIEIYGLDGSLLQQINRHELLAGKYQERISTAELPTGTYFYGITTDKGRLMNKFVVE